MRRQKISDDYSVVNTAGRYDNGFARTCVKKRLLATCSGAVACVSLFLTVTGLT